MVPEQACPIRTFSAFRAVQLSWACYGEMGGTWEPYLTGASLCGIYDLHLSGCICSVPNGKIDAVIDFWKCAVRVLRGP